MLLRQDGWQEATRSVLSETLSDRVLDRLLERSNLTRTQFETLLVDQLGSNMANRRLTRDEMTHLRRKRLKISRGAFFRTLQQARSNVIESVHTVLLLGYAGVLDSPSLVPYLEASERLRSVMERLKESGPGDPAPQRELVDSFLEDLEQAYSALKGRKRDM